MTLDRIVAEKKREVEQRKRALPLDAFRPSIEPSRRSFLDALSRPGTRFVFECKKASPSKGLLRADYEPVAIAREYEPFADAISVLTDGPFFQGSLDDLARVSAAVDRPVLRKDFILEPYQVYEARKFGADAVLLMLSVLLDDGVFLACAHAAESLGMAALVEVRDEAELARAQRLGARLIGINNRDLSTLQVDLATTERLAPLIPPGPVVISESGIGCHADVRRLRPLVRGFLIGSALTASKNLGQNVRVLVFGRVKVCGLTRPQDAAAAWRAGAMWGGLIFADESKRRVDLAQAREIRAAAPLKWAGVFVNATLDTVARAAKELHLSAVQLHGDESRSYGRALRELLPEGCEIWKAVHTNDPIPLASERGADRILADAWHPSERGGTGGVCDWRRVSEHRERTAMIVAGGLGPANAAEADELGAYALDVNSGVESAPGCKSDAKLGEVMSALRHGAVGEIR